MEAGINKQLAMVYSQQSKPAYEHVAIFQKEERDAMHPFNTTTIIGSKRSLAMAKNKGSQNNGDVKNSLLHKFLICFTNKMILQPGFCLQEY